MYKKRPPSYAYAPSMTSNLLVVYTKILKISILFYNFYSFFLFAKFQFQVQVSQQEEIIWVTYSSSISSFVISF